MKSLILLLRLRKEYLKTEGPWHSSFLNKSKEKYIDLVNSTNFKENNNIIVSNTDGKILSDSGSLKKDLIRHYNSRISWVDTIKTLKSLGIEQCLETSYSNMLRSFTIFIDRKIKYKKCGISGFINYWDKDYSESLLNKMASSLGHRGNEEFGMFSSKEVFLSNSRLSIIDLKSGTQPFLSKCKNYACVFNGEIYNYRELQEELIGTEYSITSNSDSEVLVNYLAFKGG